MITDVDETKYGQIQQMVGKIGWLSKVGLQKGQEQEQNIEELNCTLQE